MSESWQPNPLDPSTERLPTTLSRRRALTVIGAGVASLLAPLYGVARALGHGASAATPAPTPSSLVYYDVHSGAPPRVAIRNYRLALPGAVTNAKGAELSELRGWLRAIECCPNLDERPNPVDWSFDLELDPAWTDQLDRLRPPSRRPDVFNMLMRPGSILRLPLQSHRRAAVSEAILHVEMMSWQHGQTISQFLDRVGGTTVMGRRKVPEPVGWSYQHPPGVYWPWNPRTPSNEPGHQLRVGDYVRMVGAMVTDFPHGIAYDPNYPDWFGSPINPARWTEMHPPDLIERVFPRRAPIETVRCVAIFAASGLFHGETNEIAFDVPAPSPRPSPRAVLGWREIVDPTNTVFHRIKVGNHGASFHNTGAQVTVYPDHIHVRVAVQGDRHFAAPGKFKAIYRVFWVLPPAPTPAATRAVTPTPAPTSTPMTTPTPVPTASPSATPTAPPTPGPMPALTPTTTSSAISGL